MKSTAEILGQNIPSMARPQTIEELKKEIMSLYKAHKEDLKEVFISDFNGKLNFAFKIPELPQLEFKVMSLNMKDPMGFGVKFFLNSQEKKHADKEAKEAQKAFEKSYYKSGLGKEYFEKEIKNFERIKGAEALIDKTIDYIEHYKERFNDGQNMFVYGPVGNGKTMSAHLIAKTAIQLGYGVRLINMPEWLQNAKNSFEKDSKQSFEKMLHEAQNIDLLIMDELNSNTPSAWQEDVLYQVLNKRDILGKPTIINTNMTIQEFSERLDPKERLSSRLLKKTDFIENSAPDYRPNLRRVS